MVELSSKQIDDIVGRPTERGRVGRRSDAPPGAKTPSLVEGELEAQRHVEQRRVGGKKALARRHGLDAADGGVVAGVGLADPPRLEHGHDDLIVVQGRRGSLVRQDGGNLAAVGRWAAAVDPCVVVGLPGAQLIHQGQPEHAQLVGGILAVFVRASDHHRLTVEQSAVEAGDAA